MRYIHLAVYFIYFAKKKTSAEYSIWSIFVVSYSLDSCQLRQFWLSSQSVDVQITNLYLEQIGLAASKNTQKILNE